MDQIPDMELPGLEKAMELVSGHINIIVLMLSEVPGIPNIGEAVLHHVCFGSEQLTHKLSGQELQTLSEGFLRVSTHGKYVYMKRYSRDIPTTIGSYATLKVFFTSFSGLLTKFNSTLEIIR